MPRELTILMAEDDDGHAILLQSGLRKAGVRHPVVRFTNGQEALDYLQGRHPTMPFTQGQHYVLLLDIRMPKVDGVEVLRQVKNQPNLRTLPVIMLSTTDDPGEINRCHALGCNSYVVKPVEYPKFADTIRRLGEFLNLVEVPDLPR